MQNESRELWEIFKGYYNVKRLHNYMFTINRISEEFKKEYVERISAEFKRSQELDELDFSLFSPAERVKLTILIKQPYDYYLKYVIGNGNSKEVQKLTAENKKLKKKLKDIETSTTFKVGKIVMFIPIKIKKLIKKMMK